MLPKIRRLPPPAVLRHQIGSVLDFSAGCLAALTASFRTNKLERDLCLLRVRTSRASEIRMLSC